MYSRCRAAFQPPTLRLGSGLKGTTPGAGTGTGGRFGNLADARPAFLGGRLHHFPDIATRVAPAVEFLDRHIPIGP
jgi:hypothetical protein